MKTAPKQRSVMSARYQKLKVLYRISDLINTTQNSATLLRRILREAVDQMGAASGSLSFVNDEEQVLEIAVAQGIDARSARQLRLPLGKGITGHVAKTGRAMRVDDVAKSTHYIELKRGVRSELAVPMKIEGQVIGVVNVNATAVGAFSADDERLLSALASQAAKVIHTSRLYDRVGQQTRRLEALFDAAQALISADPLPEVLNRITATVQALMSVKLCSMMLLSNKRELVLSAVSGGSSSYAQRPAIPVAESLVGEVVTRRQPLQVFDVKKAGSRYRAVSLAKKEKLASLLSVPVFFQETLIGILNIYTEKPRQFDSDEMRLLEAFASLCGIAIENAQRYEQMLAAEQSLRQTDRLATLGILSAELAHEIRNPVTIIKMLLHSLREENAVAQGRERDMQVIAEKLERIEGIVTQVLGFARRQRPRLEWVDLNMVLRDLFQLIRHAAAARHVIIRTSYAAQLPAVIGDRGHFDQVFLNLLLNALEAMPSGGVLQVRTEHGISGTEQASAGNNANGNGTVAPDFSGGGSAADEIIAEQPPAAGEVQVTIRDTGVGISPELLPQLFHPFVTSRPEGVGLGLFVSQKLLGQYGGSIRVRSSQGKGTTFVVSVPIERPREQEAHS